MDRRKAIRAALAVVAVLVLAGSAAAFYFSLQPKGETDKLVVNGKDYPWETVFKKFARVSFKAGEESYTGIRLSELLNDTGLRDPESHRYRITGSDGYQKEVSWADILNGYLVEEEKKTVFPGLTRSFWIRDVITIEVV